MQTFPEATHGTEWDGSFESGRSGVSWAAVFAGATVAAALSLVMVILGFGLGLSSISPWSGQGASSETIAVSTIIWIAFTQIAAASLGGYLAGRLRVKWTDLHTDEVHFRDTAHGLLAWSVSSLATAIFLTGAISTILSGATQAGTTLAEGAMRAGSSLAGSAMEQSPANKSEGSMDYFVDGLFRADPGFAGNSDATSVAASDQAMHSEALVIFAKGLHDDSLAENDKTYLAQIIAKRTGLSQAEAESRVDNLYGRAKNSIAEAKGKAKQMADSARKAAAHSSLWMFITLLCGAFCASLAATFGGRRRDFV